MVLKPVQRPPPHPVSLCFPSPCPSPRHIALLLFPWSSSKPLNPISEMSWVKQTHQKPHSEKQGVASGQRQSCPLLRCHHSMCSSPPVFAVYHVVILFHYNLIWSELTATLKCQHAHSALQASLQRDLVMGASLQDRLWPRLAGVAGPAALCAEAEPGSFPARTHLEKMCVFPCAQVSSLLPFTGNCITVLETTHS